MTFNQVESENNNSIEYSNENVYKQQDTLKPSPARVQEEVVEDFILRVLIFVFSSNIHKEELHPPIEMEGDKPNPRSDFIKRRKEDDSTEEIRSKRQKQFLEVENPFAKAWDDSEDDILSKPAVETGSQKSPDENNNIRKPTSPKLSETPRPSSTKSITPTEPIPQPKSSSSKVSVHLCEK